MMITTMVIVVDFVFTPQRLTPYITEFVNDMLEAKVDIGKVELTFFSSFPTLRATIHDLSISSKTDTINPSACDTLLNVTNCYASINPLQLLRGKMVINHFTLNEPTLYAYIASNGKANWDLLKQDSIVLSPQVKQDSAKQNSLLWDIDLQNLEIKNANLTFDDRSTRLYGHIKNMDLHLQGALLTSLARVAMNFSSQDILFWQNDQLLVHKLKLGVIADMQIDREHRIVTLEKTILNVNGIRLNAGGILQGNAQERFIDLNIHYGIDIPSLKTILEMVPSSILVQKSDVTVNGNVIFTGTIQGRYGQGTFPLLKADLSISNGKIAYKDMPIELEQLDVKASAFIDLNRQQSSHIELSKFIFKGGATEFNAQIFGKQLLTNPHITTQLHGNINLTDLTEIFPLQDSITCKGLLQVNLTGNSSLKDIQEGDYGKIKLEGALGVENIEIIIPQEQLKACWKNAGIKFVSQQARKTQPEVLNGIIGFSGLDLIYKDLCTLVMDTTFITLSTSPLKDTSSIATISSIAQLGKSEIIVRDTLLLGVDRVTARAKLFPTASNKKVPCLSVDASIEDLRSQLLANSFRMKNASLGITLCRDADNEKIWYSSGNFLLDKLTAFSPFFPLPIEIPGTSITIFKNNIILDSAVVHIGDSHLRLTGSLYNAGRWFLHNETLNARFAVTSEMLNCNQLIHAMSIGEEYRKQVQEGLNQSISHQDSSQNSLQNNIEKQIISDSTTSIFVVPPKIDFIFQTDIKQAVFGKLYMDSIHGEVTMRNQSIELSKLKMRSSAANMETSILYRASDAKEAYTGFSMNMYDIRIDSLVHLIPALDTLFPMLQSFEGVVNFQMAGETHLDSSLNVILPTLRGAAYLDGHNLVLMDGETFSEISKMLMFKNKKKNSIDSVSVSILIRNGSVEIFPFLVEIDRYKAAVGGKHNIDMSFNYHVSLLKSPLPFRAGVDVYGTLDKMKFRITKAKYKDLFIPSRRNVIDSTKLNIEQELKRKLNAITDK